QYDEPKRDQEAQVRTVDVTHFELRCRIRASIERVWILRPPPALQTATRVHLSSDAKSNSSSSRCSGSSLGLELITPCASLIRCSESGRNDFSSLPRYIIAHVSLSLLR